VIIRSGSKYVVKSEDGSKTLGTYDSEEEAKKRLAQIEYFKNASREAGGLVKGRRRK